MAIVRAQDEVYESIDGVHFLMRDDIARRNFPCVITREALTERGSTHEPPLARSRSSRPIAAKSSAWQPNCWERGEADHRGFIRVTSAQFPNRPAAEPFR